MLLLSIILQVREGSWHLKIDNKEMIPGPEILQFVMGKEVGRVDVIGDKKGYIL